MSAAVDGLGGSPVRYRIGMHRHISEKIDESFVKRHNTKKTRENSAVS